MKAASLGLLPLLALTALFVGQRENVIFTGRVTDAVSGLPIDGATVTVTTMGSTTTDDAGEFRLTIRGQTLANRVVEIRVEHSAYNGDTKTVTITGETVEIDFALRASLETSEREQANEPKPSDRPRTELAAVEAPDKDVVGVLMNRQVGTSLNRAAMADALSYGNLPGRFDPDFNTEAYDHLDENPFLAVGTNPRSTFSIDVDRASYSNMRRFIESGRRPPKDAVRIEELVNYFSYDYPDPTGEHPFAVVTEVSDAPWNPAHRLVRIGIQGERVDTADLPPTNLVFLIDVSGSMQSANKLPLLKASFRLLVDQLRPEDRVAIAVYAGAAGLVLPSTPGNEKDKILAAIDQLEAGGSTAGGAGIRLAYRVAQENHLDEGNNRVILATDGDFNVGASSDGEMVRLIEGKREQGTFLTVLGFGTGNLKDSKMEKLADHGNGNFAYIDTINEAKKVLITEMGGTLREPASVSRTASPRKTTSMKGTTASSWPPTATSTWVRPATAKWCASSRGSGSRVRSSPSSDSARGI